MHTQHLNEDLLNRQLPDGGPLYAETNLDRFIKEPFNMITALFFIGLAVYWLWRLRPVWGQYWLITACLFVLAVGGLGGALFHGLRMSYVFLLLDVVPIFMLTIGFAGYLWVRVFRRWYMVLVIVPLEVLLHNMVAMAKASQQAATTLSYVNLGILIIAPWLIFLIRNRFRHGHLALGALLSFALALVCRMGDAHYPDLLPMGLHWLWHSFGALASGFVAIYWLKVERERIGVAY